MIFTYLCKRIVSDFQSGDVLILICSNGYELSEWKWFGNDSALRSSFALQVIQMYNLYILLTALLYLFINLFLNILPDFLDQYESMAHIYGGC